jgi:hypothetical protein
MYFRTLNIIFVFFGLLLSSPTIKASFCSAKPLKQIYRERVNFEKKVNKPFQSYYVAKGKRSYLEHIEFTAPDQTTELFSVACITFLFIPYNGVFFPRPHHSLHPQRGPPVI